MFYVTHVNSALSVDQIFGTKCKEYIFISLSTGNSELLILNFCALDGRVPVQVSPKVRKRFDLITTQTLPLYSCDAFQPKFFTRLYLMLEKDLSRTTSAN